MTLPASGNPISFSQVDVELGYSATAQISMNDTAVRTLFGVASGAIGMSCGLGKSNTSVPGAPTGVSASATGTTTATVSFTAPGSNGGLTITSYTAVSSPGSITGTLSQAGSGTITISGLSPSTSYTFTVYATNSKGNSASSSASNSITTAALRYLYAWGNNNVGQLGLNNQTYYSSPKQVGSLGNWSAITVGGTFSLAIKTDGTLWSWGNNDQGELGLGNITRYSTPKQVGALTNWASITSGDQAVAAIKTDGSLWAWGQSNYGALGLGSGSANYKFSSPTQVGSLTNWSQVSAGGNFTLAIKTDGSLWAWGFNPYGNLGLNTGTFSYFSPKQVGSLTNWLSVSAGNGHSLAIKTDGTLWSWGQNVTGELGIGNITNKYSPVQVGALTNWVSIKGLHYVSLGVKTDNSLWTWGYNGFNQLGLGTTSSDRYSSPMQVGSLTNWLSLSGGQYHVSSIKTDGTLWGWGRNDSGQIGDGTVVNKSSPVQVGGLTNWKTLAGWSGGTTVLAISG